LAKIAIELERALARRKLTGETGRATPRRLARGQGWSVADVVCTCGVGDRPFEERHALVCVAVVVAGSFQYHASTRAAGRDGELMTPGSLLLGSPGQCFECGHDHAAGDRCVSFHFEPGYFERIASSTRAGTPAKACFPRLRLPPTRELSPIVSAAAQSLLGGADASAWEEIAVRLAATALRVASGVGARAGSAPPGAVARVTRVLRDVERSPAAGHTLAAMARTAGLSEYHFLRVFEQVAGVTPHQYVLRARLRDAALRLAEGDDRVLDVALDAGFGDVSNFNRAFRSEFHVSPRAYRRGVGRRRGGS
jgi:AraC-like DNA-binding protein